MSIAVVAEDSHACSPSYRKGTKFRGNKFSLKGGFIFVFAMKMISDGGRIINIRGVKFSRSQDYPRKTRSLSKFRTLIRYILLCL